MSVISWNKLSEQSKKMVIVRIRRYARMPQTPEEGI